MSGVVAMMLDRSPCRYPVLAVLILATTPALAADTSARFLYPITTNQTLKTPKFTVDVSDVPDDPDVEQWANAAKTLCEQWFALTCRFLATDDWTPPETIQLVFKQQQKAPAFASGSKISVSAPLDQGPPRRFRHDDS